jgi:hypothetical protein
VARPRDPRLGPVEDPFVTFEKRKIKI